MPEAPASRLRHWRVYWHPAAVRERTARWFRVRLDNLDLFDEHATKEDLKNPLFLAGGGAYFYLVLVWISGVLLILYYIPTVSEAWDSIRRIQAEVPFGWLIRGVHKYGADAFIILVTVRIFRMLFRGEYKRPGELSWIIAILLLLFGMYSGLTGYLLIWNQRALWATKVFATFPTYLDDIPYLGLMRSGVMTAQLLLGGAGIGPATITRFYMLHYTFSLVLLLLTELHFYKRRYPEQGKPWVKVSRMNLSWSAILIYSAMVVVVSAMLPAVMGGRADPEVTPVPVLSDWYFLALYQMFKEMKPVPAVIGTMAIPLIAVLMPWFDSGRERSAGKRPLFVLIGVMACIYWIVFSWLIILDYVNILKDPYIWYMSMIVALLVGYVWQYRPKREPKPFWGISALGLWVVIGLFVYVFCLEGLLRTNALTLPHAGVCGPIADWLTVKVQAIGAWSAGHLYFGPWPQDIVAERVVYNIAVLIPVLPALFGVYWHFRSLPYSAWVGTAVASVIYFFVFSFAILSAKAMPDLELAAVIGHRLGWAWPGWAMTMFIGGGVGWLVGWRRAASAAAATAQPELARAPAP